MAIGHWIVVTFLLGMMIGMLLGASLQRDGYFGRPDNGDGDE